MKPWDSPGVFGRSCYLQEVDMPPIATLITPTPDDIQALIRVECLAWTAQGQDIAADPAKLAARIKHFPDGISLAFVDGVAAGSQYSFCLDWDGNPGSLTSWDQMTCGGHYELAHQEEGNTGFLVGVGVIPAYRGKRFAHDLPWRGEYRLSELLVGRTLDTLFSAGVKQVIGNARIPAYLTRPDLDVEAYCSLRRGDGRLYDPVLRFHERMGAKILRPVAYSMQDAESLDAGCWIIYKKKFRG